MATTDLSHRNITFTVTPALRTALDAAVAKYNASQVKAGYTGRASYTTDGETVTMEVGSLPIYQGDTSQLAEVVMAATDVWMRNRVWMNTDSSKGYKKIGYVHKGNLCNTVGYIVWYPKSLLPNKEFHCSSMDGTTKTVMPTLSKAKNFMMELAAKHPEAPVQKAA